MRNLWKTYLAWLERMKQKRLGWWERKRAKGAVRVVLSATLMWSSLMIVSTSLADYYLDGYVRFDRLHIKVIAYLIGGFFVGLVGWWSNERDYQKSLKAHLAADTHFK
jgi:cell division protein FtsW (lipid II flippase)